MKKTIVVVLVIILLPVLLIAAYLFWLDFRWNFESDLANHFRNFNHENAPFTAVDISNQIKSYEKNALLKLIRDAGFECKNTDGNSDCVRAVPDIVCSQSWWIDVTFGNDRLAKNIEATIGISCL